MTRPPASVASVPVDLVVRMLAVGAAEDGDQESQIRAILGDLELSPKDIDRIGRDLRHLVGTSDRRRRRGQALAALLSGVKELAQLRDVDALAEQVVGRAHEMVGSDATYLTEFDPASRELRVLATLGANSPSMVGSHVPPGTGLTSMVLESRSPRSTINYAEMTQAPRDPAMDALVVSEGLVSLLAVPVLAGEEVIAVLFVASRVERAFSAEETWLLSTFADHVAVVLQTARLLARAQEAGREARRAYGELARNAEAIERASAVHAELTSVVLRGGDATDVAAALGRVLRSRVAIVRADASAAGPFDLTTVVPFGVCGAGEAPDSGPDDELGTIAEAVERSRRGGRCMSIATGEAGVGGGLAMAIVAGRSLLGAIVVEQREAAFETVDHRIAERAAQIAASLKLGPESVIDAEQRVRADLLADLLSDDPARRVRVAERALPWDIRVEELSAMVVMVVPPKIRRHVLRAVGQAVGPHALVGERDEWIISLVAGSEPDAAARRIHQTARRCTDSAVLAVGVGISLSPADPHFSAGLHGQLDSAMGCARILPSFGMTDTAVSTDEFLPYTALFGPGEARVHAFVRQMLGPVLDWDADRGGGLLATLEAYLDNRSSPQATGRVLHLHKNTVLQRLKRIDELLGEDWQSPDRLFRINVAVRVARLTSSLAQSDT